MGHGGRGFAVRTRIVHIGLVGAVVAAVAFGLSPQGWAAVTAVCAAVAAVVNARAAVIAHRAPDSVRAPVYAFTAAMALLYVAAFGLLAFRTVDRVMWSEVMTPVAAFTFVSVWIVHALVLVWREEGGDQ